MHLCHLVRVDDDVGRGGDPEEQMTDLDHDSRPEGDLQLVNIAIIDPLKIVFHGVTSVWTITIVRILVGSTYMLT